MMLPETAGVAYHKIANSLKKEVRMTMKINSSAMDQRGKSLIGNLLVLAIIGLGVWVGIQFIPMKIQQGTMNTILDKVEQRHHATPYQSEADLWGIIDKNLNINEMRDMRQYFRIQRLDGGAYRVTVDFEQELNLVFMSIDMDYNNQLLLGQKAPGNSY